MTSALRLPEPDPPPSALLKGLSVLEAVIANERLSDVSRVTGLSNSTVHRILADLKEDNWIYQDEERRYHPGPKMHAIASMLRDEAEIVAQAGPYLERLRQQTAMTVHMGLIHADAVVYAAKLDGHGSYRMVSRVGGSVPLHCTSIGKSVLATLPDEQVRAIVERTGLRRKTERTHTTVTSLLAELNTTRERGWALDDGENEDLLRCVGAAIIDAGGRSIGGVSVSALEFEVPDWRLDGLAEHVTEAARAISSRLGAG